MGKESKVAERQRERESVCVRVLVETDGSVDQHPQTGWEEDTFGILLIAGIFDQLATFGEIWRRWSFSLLICYNGSDI